VCLLDRRIKPVHKYPHEAGWFGEGKPNFMTTAPKLRLHQETPEWFDQKSAYADKEKSDVSGSVWVCGEQV